MEPLLYPSDRLRPARQRGHDADDGRCGAVPIFRRRRHGLYGTVRYGRGGPVPGHPRRRRPPVAARALSVRAVRVTMCVAPAWGFPRRGSA